MGFIDNPIRLDLNNPVFQEHLFGLQKPERNAAIDTLRKSGFRVGASFTVTTV